MSIFDTIHYILNHPFNRGRTMRALTRYFTWQFASRMYPAIAADFVDQTKLLATRGMTGATGNIYCGLHEFEDMAFVLHALRPGDLFVDVGANIGSYSLLAKTAGADVIAFEPGERFEDLCRNMAVNGFTADCRKVAVGSETGTVRFTVGRDAMNKIASDGDRSVEVPLTTLDVALNRQPTVLKIDVEGFESAVLAGGINSISGASAVLFELVGQGAEHGFDECKIVTTLQSLGFQMASYDPARRALIPPVSHGNTLFVKPGIAERLFAAPKFNIQGKYI